jgi:hypothetical protein
LKKRLKAAQADLAEAYGTQRDLIDEFRRACWPTDEEERILHTMERVAGVMELRLEYLNQECTEVAAGDPGQQSELPRFILND